MVATTTEILTVNGVLLNTLAKNVSSLTGRLRAPAFRTGNLVLPGRHGEMRIPNKMFQANQITLPMWVLGCNDDGAIPSGSTKRKEFFKRVDELVSLFKSAGSLDIRHTRPDGSVRQCYAEALDVMDFTTDASPRALVGVVLTIYGSFWQDIDTTTQELTGTGTTLDPTEFAGSQAAITDMIWEVTGPWTNPRLTFSDGSWVQYSAALSAGNVLEINCAAWTIIGSGGLTADYSKLTHDGEDAFWAALPAPPAAITLGGSARTTASKVSMTGRRKFLVG